MEDKEESKGVVNNKADESAPTAPLAADPEPIHAPNNHAVNHNSPPLQMRTLKTAKKSVIHWTMEKFWWLRKWLFQSIQSFQARMMPLRSQRPLLLKHKTKSPRNLLHQWYANIYRHLTDIFQVHDLKKSNSPFDVVLRVPPVKLVEQSRVTAAAAIETAPNSNSSMDKNNNNAVKGHSIFVGNLLDTATVGQLKVVFEQFGPIKPDGIQVRSQKQTGNCFGFVEFESASSVQGVLRASPISIGNRRASIEVKRDVSPLSYFRHLPLTSQFFHSGLVIYRIGGAARVYSRLRIATIA